MLEFKELDYHQSDSRRQLNPNAAAALAGGGAAVFITTPAFANEGSTAVSKMLETVATVATAAIGILIVALGARLAVKQVNRILTKG